jgi:hypothetical protein
MKFIKTIFFTLIFFTFPFVHSQTDEEKKNLYEQEKIRIEKLENDAQYHGDDEIIRKRMNLPAKLPSFDKWVASEPVKIEKIEKIEKNEIITQQPEPQKVVIEDNKPINNTETSSKVNSNFITFIAICAFPILYLILNFIFYNKNNTTKKILIRPPFGIGNKIAEDDVSGAATKNTRLFVEFGALCAWGFIGFLPIFAGVKTNETILETVLISGFLAILGHLIYLPLLMVFAYATRCPKCKVSYARKVVNTFKEPSQNYRTSKTNPAGQTFFTDHETGVNHTDYICQVCSHEWRISKSYHSTSTA